jgi:tripartite-type tricarboxylate transporter receptor subunit TctC
MEPALAQQNWPTKPIRIVVGFPPGGTTDVMARVIGAPLSKALGQPVIVDNKPGASGNIATSEVIRAPADGYTLMIAPISVQTANPHLFKPALNPEKDLQPVVSLGYAQLYLVAKNGLPVKSANELVQMAKTKPGQLSYGSGGPGTQMHLVGELFKQQAGIDVVHVPYKGAAPALQDILAGQIDYYFDPATGFSHIREGRARLLAVTGTKRSPFFPDTPTLSELGIKGVELGNWFGVFAPAATPPEVVARIHQEVAKALTSQDIKQRFGELGAEATALDAAAFRSTIANESRVLSALIKERKIAVD